MTGLEPLLTSTAIAVTSAAAKTLADLAIEILQEKERSIWNWGSQKVSDKFKKTLKELTTCDVPNANNIISKALEKGRLLILLDGVDEIPASVFDRAIYQIRDFVTKFPENRYIVSRRTAFYSSGFRSFTDVTIADFNEEQIQQFIFKWFQSPKDQNLKVAEKCWRTLRRSENVGAYELAHRPLLLTFLCMVYDRSGTFPRSRSTLYHKALRILLEEWEADKRVLRDEIYSSLVKIQVRAIANS